MQFVCISSISAEYLHKILRGGVHDEKQWTKNRALETPQEEVYKDEKVLLRLTRKERDDK